MSRLGYFRQVPVRQPCDLVEVVVLVLLIDELRCQEQDGEQMLVNLVTGVWRKQSNANFSDGQKGRESQDARSLRGAKLKGANRALYSEGKGSLSLCKGLEKNGSEYSIFVFKSQTYQTSSQFTQNPAPIIGIKQPLNQPHQSIYASL